MMQSASAINEFNLVVQPIPECTYSKDDRLAINYSSSFAAFQSRPYGPKVSIVIINKK